MAGVHGLQMAWNELLKPLPEWMRAILHAGHYSPELPAAVVAEKARIPPFKGVLIDNILKMW